MEVDPFFNDVILLLHCEGSNGSTTFTDSSHSAKTVTANGNAQLSTAQFKFGSTSGLFDGTGDYLSVSNAALDFGSGDFTVECWVRTSSLTAVQGIFFNGTLDSNNSRIQLDIKTTGVLTLFAANSSGTVSFSIDTSTGSIVIDTWYHVAAVRSGSSIVLYLNGDIVGSDTVDNEPAAGNTYYVGYARNGGLNRYLTGYLDDLRITKGLARYTGAFTPPTAAFPDEQGHDLPLSSLTWTAQLLGQSGALVKDFLPTAAIAWIAQPPISTPVLPEASLAWTAQLPESGLSQVLPASTLTWTIQALGQQLSHSLPARPLTWTTKSLQFTFDAPVVGQSPAIYRAYLYADGYERLELPLASFQSTRRNGEATYLSIVVPAPTAYLDGIEDRLDGEIVLYSGFVIGGVETLTELIRANLSSFRYDLGANSGSATLTGYKQVTYTNPKTIALQGISFKSAIDDVRRVRCEPDMWLNPGDTADLGGGETMVVGRIAYTINPKSATMEVIEVET